MLPATVDNTHSSSLPWEQLCRRFSLSEIRSTTQNFDDALVIGQGGFGKVYRGTINDGSGRSSIAAAIKRLDSRSKQGASEFWAEIEMLSKLRHCHLVSLIGYCNEFDEMILVYEFMPHGTLSDHLHIVGTRLSWLQRLKICIGAARGLDYLHTGSGTRHGVIHRDVKTSNILLDENWEAKISDFGLSKVGPKNQPSTFVSTAVKGTFGYVDPEYFLTGRLTRKSDVYAFGVVLLEVLCGRRAVDRSLDEDQWGLAGWAQDCIKKGKLEQIVDSSLRGQILLNCLEEFAQIAEWCLRSRPDERPTMAEVVGRLDLALALQETPDYPGPGYSATPPRKITFTRKILKFFFPCLGPLMKNGTNEEGTSNNKFSNEDLGVNKEGDVSQEVQQSAQIVTLNVKVFTFAELKQITRNFRPDRLLGEGSSGVVFKGMVDEETYEPSNAGGMFVAVKKREANSGLGQAEWQAEVNFLGQFGHPNIIHLLGYCREDQEFLLVYEFMTNGSLDNHIFSRRYLKPLPWAVRLKIMIGAAQGLAFLHTMDNQVIHRNFKSSSILLDADYNPKLSGFGLAKCGSVSDGCSHVSTRVMGTSGYAAPEYVLTGHLSAKSDVYGFGVVLLEVLAGRRVLDVNRPNSERNLVEWARPYLSDKRRLLRIVDGRLEGQYPVRGAVQAAELALQCLNVAPKERPSMKEVLQTLEKINAFKFQPENIRAVERATARQAGPSGREQIRGRA